MKHDGPAVTQKVGIQASVRRGMPEMGESIYFLFSVYFSEERQQQVFFYVQKKNSST